MALYNTSKLLQLKNGTLASSNTAKYLIRNQVNVSVVEDFQLLLMQFPTTKPRELSRNEIHFINQWKKFHNELTTENYLALLQLYINEQFTTKAVEVVDKMISYGLTVPPTYFHQLILIGTSWKKIMSVRNKWINKDSRLVIDKMVFRHLSNVYARMEDGRYDKCELKETIEQVRKSIYYYKTNNKQQPTREKRPREQLKNYMLMLIATNESSELSLSEIRRGLSEKFKIEATNKRIERALNNGPFSQSVLNPKKWKIGKETGYVYTPSTQNNDVQKYIEKFSNNLLNKYWKYPIEKLVNQIISLRTPRKTIE